VPELGYSLEGPDKRELREVAGKLIIASQPVGETVHAVHMAIVQLALCLPFPRNHARDQLSFVHPASALIGDSKRRHLPL
jgi:hypothetical protein